MKSIRRLSRSASAFSIVEMIAVIAVIAILVGLLVPALSLVQEMASKVSQKAQFASISMGLETFRDEMGDYPASTSANSYTGAQRLSESMVGLDGSGFHPASRWDGDPPSPPAPAPVYDPTNTDVRKGPYLELDTANAVKIKDIYENFGTLAGDSFVLTDKFKTVKHLTTRKKIGMPILYFKANTLPVIPDYPVVPFPPSINDYAYSFNDNASLIALLTPDQSEPHPMFGTIAPGLGAAIFYEATSNPNFSSPAGKPHNNESFILLSAGSDGLYGTDDDIYNFESN